MGEILKSNASNEGSFILVIPRQISVNAFSKQFRFRIAKSDSAFLFFVYGRAVVKRQEPDSTVKNRRR